MQAIHPFAKKAAQLMTWAAFTGVCDNFSNEKTVSGGTYVETGVSGNGRRLNASALALSFPALYTMLYQ